MVRKSHNVCPPRSAYVLSFFGFYETTDVFFGSLANIDLRGNPRVRTLKTEKIFLAHSDQGSMERREKLFLGNI